MYIHVLNTSILYSSILHIHPILHPGNDLWMCVYTIKASLVSSAPHLLGRPIQASHRHSNAVFKTPRGGPAALGTWGTSNHINAAQLWSTGSLLRVVWRMFAINHPYLSLLPEASLPSHISMDMLHPWCLQKNKRFSIHRERERETINYKDIQINRSGNYEIFWGWLCSTSIWLIWPLKGLASQLNP